VMKEQRLLSMMLGGVPVVLLIVAFGPRPPAGTGFLVWLAALVVIGWVGTALFYSLVQVFKSDRW
jgi:hypothetical protein